jgi:hypothetical protein
MRVHDSMDGVEKWEWRSSVEHNFGDESEPVCVNGSVKSGSLIKLLFFFGKQIQQGSLESPGWSLSRMQVVVGLDGGRRISSGLLEMIIFFFWRRDPNRRR